MPLRLDSEARAGLLDFVRPLSVGVDGATNFGFVERRLAVVERLAAAAREREPEAAIDAGRLFLLAAFAGLPERRHAGGGRTELLLASAGVPREDVAWLFRALRRFEADPRSLEEGLVRDAGLLESVGAYGITQMLVLGTRERMTLAEMAEEIASRAGEVRFTTDAGRAAGAERVEFSLAFARRLAAEVAEFEATPVR
ncbi:MAG TPA: hypothetical protein VKF32_05400 [Thermoanaerobaculia bacterium]|nr:hypothetical protein [Thermoanaerobaculia bacterium]